MKLEYWIRKPKGDRKSFKLYCRSTEGKTQTIVDERIDVINKLFNQGTQDEPTCLRQMVQIKDEWRGKPASAVYLDANLDILMRYWKDQYEDRPSQETSKRSRFNAFKRAVSKLGKADLANAPRKSFQDALKKVKPSQAWVYAGCYNALLRYIGRTDVKVLPPSRPKPAPRHLSLEQFMKVAEHLPDDFKLLAWVAFGTGCRWGELFALDKYEYGVVKVEWQRTEKWALVPTKNGVVRDVPTISAARGWIEKWLAVPEEKKRLLRQSGRASKLMRRACVKAELPEITFHDLRHSYGIHLLSLGKDIPDIALALGDGYEVTQRYYIGFSMPNSAAKRMAEGI